MPLSKQEIDDLLRLVGLTERTEINCEQCLALVAEFAEQKLTGKSIHEGLVAVEQHLTVCSECREEYEALRRTLNDKSFAD
ncbi:hypothetical protein [Stieleria mannarensis]|uniref:hypothetical protein n=1 Tax=Stieleria mannarensis TaxID=2755585 RepID=UPI001602A62E|nr:hypothetical protein [Rhodopirellula sp. JC639]